MIRQITLVNFCLLIYCFAVSQEFELIPADIISGTRQLKFGNILVTSRGSSLVASSLQLCEFDGLEISIADMPSTITDSKGNAMYLGKNSNIFKDLYESFAGIKLICEGPGKMIFVVSNNNNLGLVNYNWNKAIGHPPFNFPDMGKGRNITNIWVDKKGTLFVATSTDTIYYVEHAVKGYKVHANDTAFTDYKVGLDKDSNLVVTEGAHEVKSFTLGKGIIPYSFAQDPLDERILMVGTNHGLYGYAKQTGKARNFFEGMNRGECTITHVYADSIGATYWLSTLEKGMAKFDLFLNHLTFFPYPRNKGATIPVFAVQTFSYKSPQEFFVAVADSLPAIFDKETGRYTFINDTIFYKTKNRTSDIKSDPFGNLLVTKGGGLYFSKSALRNLKSSAIDSSLVGPYIEDISVSDENYESQNEYYVRDELLKEISIKYDENNVSIFYSCRGIDADSLVFAWKLENFNNDWLVIPYSIFGNRTNVASFNKLKPGRYVFRLKAKNANADWLEKQVELVINISAPYWQRWWFWAITVLALFSIIYMIVKWRIASVRKQERTKAASEKEILELEAKALRAQMNPHFIFNCLNSIKAVILKDDKDKAVAYLTTFSKLIRTIFQNSDKREISLFDELETCRLYTELESLRFGSKLSFSFMIDETIDLKSIMVPALIVQPFIENAIWHGLLPKEQGGRLEVTLSRSGDRVRCVVDDNGIGRRVSMQNKSTVEPGHDSRGVRLTQTRLELSNSINQRNATVELIDKVSDTGAAEGTQVVLMFGID